MLHQRNRLRESLVIQSVRRDGKCLRDPLAVFCFQPNGLPVTRFAIVASRRVGNAVTRNRVKRRVRAALRRHVPAVDAGYDCVVIARPALAAAEFERVDGAMRALLRRASLLRPIGDER